MSDSISGLTEIRLRARRVAELVALRLALPSRLATQPLDQLLAELSAAPVSQPAIGLNRVDLLRAERGVACLPWVSSTCLFRALGRYSLLHRSGAQPTFVMAVHRKGVAESGHAWVELDGKPFEEPDDVSHYVVTLRYRPTGPDGTIAAP